MENVSLVDGHIDNGISDEDIIKALECCTQHQYCCPKECPLYEYDFGNCTMCIMERTLNLINRYKAENEKLNIELKAMRGAANSYKAEVEGLKEFIEKDTGLILKLTGVPVNEYNQKIKSEAIKEFAERLKCNASILCDKVTGLPCSYTISNYDFNRLIKEMTESK